MKNSQLLHHGKINWICKISDQCGRLSYKWDYCAGALYFRGGGTADIGRQTMYFIWRAFVIAGISPSSPSPSPPYLPCFFPLLSPFFLGLSSTLYYQGVLNYWGFLKGRVDSKVTAMDQTNPFLNTLMEPKPSTELHVLKASYYW